MEPHVSDRALEQATAAAAPTPYSLTLINKSAQAWIFYVYQKQPMPASNVFSLAWLASPFMINAGNQITFEWQVVYNFVWGATGTVMPGVTFNASGMIGCDPSGANTTTFSTQPGPNLSAAVKAPPSGSLVINDADGVPNNTFSVGIGMSGTGTYVVQAGPHLTHQFTPTPSYWIAAGTNVRVGTVLDIQTITKTTEVKFPANVFQQTWTLNENYIWVKS